MRGLLFFSVCYLVPFGIPKRRARAHWATPAPRTPTDIHLHIDRRDKEYYDAYWLAYTFTRRLLYDYQRDTRYFITSFLGDNSKIGLVKTFEEPNDGHTVLTRLSQLRFNESFTSVDRLTYEPEWDKYTEGNNSVSILFMGPELDERYPGVSVLVLKDAKNIDSTEKYRRLVREKRFNLLGNPDYDQIFNCISKQGCDRDPDFCAFDITFVLDRESRYYWDIYWMAYITVHQLLNPPRDDEGLSLAVNLAITSLTKDGLTLLKRFDEEQTIQDNLKRLSDFKTQLRASRDGRLGDAPAKSSNLITIYIFGPSSESRPRIETEELLVSVVVNSKLPLATPASLARKDGRVLEGRIDRPTPTKIRRSLDDKCLF